MATSVRPLTAQRLVLAGLIGVMALSAVLLWLLRSSAARGRPGSATSEVVHAEETRELAGADSALAPAARTDEEHARAELPGLAPEREANPADDTFDPAAITGRVVSAGAGVAGVELRLFRGAMDRRERKTPLAEAKSDAEGRFRFRELEPFARHVLLLQHPDFLPSEETLYPGHAEELVLERAATMEGTVRSAATRTPLAGIELALERWHFETAGLQGGMRERVSATSDAEGRWRLPWAKPGIETVLVLRAGRTSERREFQVTLESSGGDGGKGGVGGYEILLGDERLLELELFALEDGSPLADTELTCDNVAVRTDARARLAVPLPPGGASDDSLRLTLALEGGCTTQLRTSLSSAGALLRVPLARGGTVRGHVLDAAGAPIAGAEVRMGGSGRLPAGIRLPEGAWLNPPRNAARTQADGSFALAGLPPREGRVELRASHPEHPPGRSEPFDFALLGEERELEIRLQHGGSVSGTVRLDGAPAALRVYWQSVDAANWTRSNDQGEYRIAGLASGEVRVLPRLDGEDEDVARNEDRSVFVEAEEDVHADFELVSHRAFVRGRVLDASGAPVPEAEVVATPSDTGDEEEEWVDEELSDECDAEGRFEVGVPDKPGLLFDVFASQGARRASASGVRAGSELDLVLPALSEVSLRVVDALRHEPVLGFQVYWRESENGEFQRLQQGGRRFSPGPDGTFLAELPAGRLDLAVSARAQGFVPARRDGLELAPGRGTTISFELETGAELELVLESTGAGQDALRLLQRGRITVATPEQWAERERGGEFFQQEVRNAQTLRLDSSGVAHLKAMPSGHYRFYGLPKGQAFRPAQFELPPVAHQRVELSLAPPAEKPAGGN